MFEIPSPYSRPSRSKACGWKPGTFRSHGSRPEYDVSMCPLNMSVGPPPAPCHVPSALARLSSTCCHCTASPSGSYSETISSAMLCSSPVKLWTPLMRLGDGPDLVLLDAGEVEQRVGRALNVLHLVREIHAGDLARPVATLVAIGRVDRRDDRTTDVDVCVDLLARVAHERRSRDRRRQATVGDLARERLHFRRGRSDVDRRHVAR